MNAGNVNRWTAVLLLAGLLMAAQASGQATAAGTARPRRVPAIVAMVARTLGGGAYELIRRQRGEGPDIILLTDSAGPQELSAAVRALMVVRARDGDTASASARFRMRSNNASTRRALPWAARVLADVRARPVEALDLVGPARSVQIWLPRAHRSQHSSGEGPGCPGDGCTPRAASGAIP